MQKWDLTVKADMMLAPFHFGKLHGRLIDM